MADSGLISNSQIFSKDNLFNRQNQQQLSYSVDEVDAVIGYFLKRGFEQIAAVNTALVILEQAKKDQIPVFKIIDTLKGVTDVTLNDLITQILNLNRSKTSVLGYKTSQKINDFEKRNIID